MTVSHATQLCPNPGTTPDIDLKIEVFLLRWDNPQTRAAYRAAIHCWADWCADRGLDPIHGVHRTHVEAWVLELKDSRKLKPTTINHRVTVLRIWFELAIDDGLIARNPCRLVRRLRVPRDNTRKSLHRNELRQLLIAARDDRPGYYALVVLMAYCGLRVSEAVGLDVEDTRVTEHSHRCARITRKGGEVALIPMPPVVQRAVDDAAGDRTTGPLIVGVLSGAARPAQHVDELVERDKAPGRDPFDGEFLPGAEHGVDGEDATLVVDEFVRDRAASLIAEHVTVYLNDVPADAAAHARGEVIDEADRQVLTKAGVTPRMVDRHTGQHRGCHRQKTR